MMVIMGIENLENIYIVFGFMLLIYKATGCPSPQRHESIN